MTQVVDIDEEGNAVGGLLIVGGAHVIEIVRLKYGPQMVVL